MFVVFEGLDGSGKTIQANLLADGLRWSGVKVVHTREPGGTPLGEELRSLLLTQDLSPRVQAMMFAAARAQHICELIRPALDKGKVVICDRFYHSSYAYQGIDEEHMKIVEDINKIAMRDIFPDIVIYLDISPEVAIARSSGKDVIEKGGVDYLESVRKRYDDLAYKNPEVWMRFDSRTNSILNIHGKIRSLVDEALEERKRE